MSLIDNIYTFFQDKIQSFPPFKNNLIYQSIIGIFLNHLVKHSYEKLPKEFKDFTTDQIINPSLYDPILKGFGFPEKLLNNLSVKNKKIMLNYDGLTDYNVYKGSLKFADKTCKLFKESINIYELYVDRSISLNKWHFVCKPIYIGTEKVTKEFLDYNKIYDKVKDYFIS